MSLERLAARGDRIGHEAAARQIRRLEQVAAPSGVATEAIDGGIALSGKRLRRRMLDDPQLRNFGR